MPEPTVTEVLQSFWEHLFQWAEQFSAVEKSLLRFVGDVRSAAEEEAPAERRQVEDSPPAFAATQEAVEVAALLGDARGALFAATEAVELTEARLGLVTRNDEYDEPRLPRRPQR